jgi:hypothetical protein
MRIDSSANLTVVGGATIQGLTVGRGANAVAYNTALGNGALSSGSLSGNYNTGVGYSALLTNTSGNSSVAVGLEALKLNTTGSNNTALGQQALLANTTASNNTAVGYQAAYSNTTGLAGTFVGYQAGYSSTGDSNTVIGNQAGFSTTSGKENIFLGGAAGYTNVTGNQNVYIGTGIGGAEFPAGYYATGSLNTFIGATAGSRVTTGSKNTILGGYTGNENSLDIRTLSNYVVLSDGDGNPTAVWDTRRNQLSSSYYGGAVSTAYYSPRGVSSYTDNGGAGITSSNLFGGNPSTGFLHVNESGTSNYLIAAIFKRNSGTAPVITVIASSVLTTGATNSGGTIVINGATTGANVKMRYIAYDGSYSL